MAKINLTQKSYRNLGAEIPELWAKWQKNCISHENNRNNGFCWIFFFDVDHVKDNNLCSKFTYVDKGKLLLIQPVTKKTKKGKLLISHMPRRPSYGKIVQDS